MKRQWTYNEETKEVLDERGLAVASLGGDSFGSLLPKDEIDPNGRLIAAAPDLLEAIKPFEWLNGIVGANDVTVTYGQLRAMWLAMAKAMGRKVE